MGPEPELKLHVVVWRGLVQRNRSVLHTLKAYPVLTSCTLCLVFRMDCVKGLCEVNLCESELSESAIVNFVNLCEAPVRKYCKVLTLLSIFIV